MSLRQKFEDEIRTNKGQISFLFETSTQHYIEWLENKVNNSLTENYPTHHCGNKLTDKELHYNFCLKCNQEIKE